LFLRWFELTTADTVKDIIVDENEDDEVLQMDHDELEEKISEYIAPIENIDAVEFKSNADGNSQNNMDLEEAGGGQGKGLARDENKTDQMITRKLK